MPEKFYDKFSKKSSSAKSNSKTHSKLKSNFERNGSKKEFSKRIAQNEKLPFQNDKKEPYNSDFVPRKINREKDALVRSVQKMFDSAKLSKESRIVLENFDEIVQGVRPLNSRQFVQLHRDIRNLSHRLTDEREERRMGYMNANEELSAYVRYFSWWNLVRFTRIFSNLPENAFNLNDGDCCIDIGSGPLTVVIAMWLSRPELREKKLTWYCIDLSSAAMALGEDIYLSVAARLPPKEKNAPPHWNIVRIKGSGGAVVNKKAAFISCANMYNELSQISPEAPEKIADKQIRQLLSYGTDFPSIFIAEPGMPTAAHFVSLMRNRFIRKQFDIVSPCPHILECPMNGFNAKYGGKVKWCNFDFSTDDAPSRLLKLSKNAGLPKERAVVSFVFAQKRFEKKENSGGIDKKETLREGGKSFPKENEIRIASDRFFVPEKGFCCYACTNSGLSLVIDSSKIGISSGDKISLSMLKNTDKLSKDKKSGAFEINL